MTYDLELFTESNFERVGEKVRAILKDEGEAQVALAESSTEHEGIDFDYEVKYENLNPFHIVQLDKPLLNIVLEAFKSKQQGFIQRNFVTFNIDVFSKGECTGDDEDFVEGSTHASKTVNRVIRQVMYILKSPKYEFLGFEDGGFVNGHDIAGFSKYIPQQIEMARNIIMGRVIFNVEVSESIPDTTGGNLGGVSVQTSSN